LISTLLISIHNFILSFKWVDVMGLKNPAPSLTPIPLQENSR